MINTVSHRFASSRTWTAGFARVATVIVPLACSSVAFGDGGLIATSGVLGLASSLGALSDAEIQAVDARGRSEAMAAESVVLEAQALSRLPQPLTRPSLPQVEKSPAPTPAVFRPARPRTAAEMRAASEPVRVTAPTQHSPSRPDVKAPAQVEGPRPDATRPVSGDRPPLPFSRLFSQVQY